MQENILDAVYNFFGILYLMEINFLSQYIFAMLLYKLIRFHKHIYIYVYIQYTYNDPFSLYQIRFIHKTNTEIGYSTVFLIYVRHKYIKQVKNENVIFRTKHKMENRIRTLKLQDILQHNIYNISLLYNASYKGLNLCLYILYLDI